MRYADLAFFSAVAPSSFPSIRFLTPLFLAMPSDIEVEKKFKPNPKLKELVLKHGGEVVGEKRFTDVYYDTAGCVLTRRDTWLRRRGDAWELKLPLGDPADRRGASGGERTVFKEVEGAESVMEALAPLLPVPSDGPLPTLLKANELLPIAEFETVRSRYKLGETSLDADVASFGHAVLEIEVMAETEAEVPAAEAEIERVAALLGTEPLGGTGGKLFEYIRTKRPDIFAQLVEAGVLRE